jgi:ATP-dependent helicase/nuclease subunit A
VILPDATGDVADAPDNGLIFDDERGRSFPSDRRMMTLRSPPRARRMKARMLGEHWRLLYVAMTRARDRLIVCGPQFGNAKLGEAKESWRLAVEEG